MIAETQEIEASVRYMCQSLFIDFTHMLLEVVDNNLLNDINDQLLAKKILRASLNADHVSLSLLCQGDAYHDV